MLSKNPPAALFLSTLSLRRATTRPVKITDCHLYFYPRSPCGERRGCLLMFCRLTLFLSTLSLRRATAQVGNRGQCAGISIHALLAESDIYSCSCVGRNRHFYPRSPCGERHNADCNYRSDNPISIHALLAESDRSCTILYSCPGNFYPRSPCGERLPGEHHANSQQEFLSTLSLRRATTNTHRKQQGQHDFYPRSPCGERR